MMVECLKQEGTSHSTSDAAVEDLCEDGPRQHCPLNHGP